MNVVAWCGSSSSNIRNRNNSSVNIFSILSLCCLWLHFQHHFDHFGNVVNCRRKHFLELSLRCLRKLAAQPSSAPIITGRLFELSLAKRSKTLWPTFDFIMSRFLRCQKSSLSFLAAPLRTCILSPQNCATFPLLLLAHILCRRHALVATELLVFLPLCSPPPLSSSSLHSVVIRHFILFCTFYYGSRLPHTFFIIMSAYQHVANILHGHRWCRSASQSQHLAPCRAWPKRSVEMRV